MKSSAQPSNLRKRAALLLLPVMLLGGCVSFGPKTPRFLFNLSATDPAPAGALAAGVASDALVVLDPEADRRVDVQRVAVQVDDSNVAYLTDAAWVERPTRLFRRLLAETIRARGNKLVVEGSDAEAGGKVALGGRLLDMGYDARSQSVVVRFDALKLNSGGITASRRFEARVSGVEATAEAVGPALNSAANDVAKQVSDWIG